MSDANERLRELLDERGVEWDGESYTDATFWNEETNLAVASDDHDGKLWVSMRLTPEQAIEATLGPSDPREHGLIPHFWTGDETLHISLGKLPERIDVNPSDPRGREVFSARKHRFEPERGECRNKDRDYVGFWCSECDAHVADEYFVGTDVEEFKYCPNCGRKVIKV